MGYTHSWNHDNISSEEFVTLAADAKRIIDAAGVNVAGPAGIGEPVLTDRWIELNGAGDESYEFFHLSPMRTGYHYCKTGSQPYDVVVATILLRAALTIPGFHVSSDGTWDEWSGARDLYGGLFGPAPGESPLSR